MHDVVVMWWTLTKLCPDPCPSKETIAAHTVQNEKLYLTILYSIRDKLHVTLIPKGNDTQVQNDGHFSQFWCTAAASAAATTCALPPHLLERRRRAPHTRRNLASIIVISSGTASTVVQYH